LGALALQVTPQDAELGCARVLGGFSDARGALTRAVRVFAAHGLANAVVELLELADQRLTCGRGWRPT
jgi:hypothetical protein